MQHQHQQQHDAPQPQPQPLPLHPFDSRMSPRISPGASSRILYDVPCKVCQDHSSGKHYGIFACDGCAGFFKRSIRRARQYVCKAKAEGSCVVDKTHRNQCRACRLRKCLKAGMNKDAVQHERGPRNSTLRRQLALYLKEPTRGRGSPPPPPSAAGAAAHADGTAAALHASHVASMKLLSPALALRPVDVLCENAAQLLFMNVQWAKTNAAFTALPMNDQLALLEESWRDLFVVGAAQVMPTLDAAQMSALLGPRRSLPLAHQLQHFQDVLRRFALLAVDPHEYTFLRGIALFKTVLETPGRRLEAAQAVCLQQDFQQRALCRYVAMARLHPHYRVESLLMSLPLVRQIAPDTIEELFFRPTIGTIPIHRIICDMYRGDSAPTPAAPASLPASSPEL